MAKQLLIYQSAVPISAARHAKVSIEASDSYAFSAGVNAVPLMAIEFARASAEYAIVFAAEGEESMPVVVLGVRNEQTLYLSADAHWKADYIPAFIRRYPFVFSQQENTYTLCVDESWSGCNKDGKGERLFDEKGERTEYLSRMLKFLEESQAHFVRTQTYCKHLKEMDLLEPMKADFTLPGGTKKSLGGFMAVNRDKLRKLAPEKLAELAKTDELELTYIHLLSMNNFRRVLERTAKAAAANAAVAAE